MTRRIQSGISHHFPSCRIRANTKNTNSLSVRGGAEEEFSGDVFGGVVTFAAASCDFESWVCEFEGLSDIGPSSLEPNFRQLNFQVIVADDLWGGRSCAHFSARTSCRALIKKGRNFASTFLCPTTEK